MKKLLLLLVTLLFGLTYSQEKQFANLDSITYHKYIDEFVRMAGDGYVKDTIVDEQYTYYRKEGEKVPFIIKHYVSNEGEIKELDIKGTTKYRIQEIVGEFKIVFPIFKKYFKPDADAKEIIEKGKASNIGKYDFRRWDDTIWRLRF